MTYHGKVICTFVVLPRRPILSDHIPQSHNQITYNGKDICTLVVLPTKQVLSCHILKIKII